VEEVLANSPANGLPEGAPGGINEKIRHLIRQSKEQGYLTFDDINEALPDSVENQDEIDNVLSILQNLDIEIIESEEVESFKQRQEEAEEGETRC
jgi:RNA polymerase primary sigma factor